MTDIVPKLAACLLFFAIEAKLSFFFIMRKSILFESMTADWTEVIFFYCYFN